MTTTPRRPRLALRLALIFAFTTFAGSAWSQTTITFTADETRSTATSTTAASPVTITLAASGATATQSGLISGDGPLTKTGAGRILLTASNTYTGNTTISAGTLALANRNTSPNLTIGSGAALELTTSGNNLSFTTATSFSGSGTLRKTGDHAVQWGSVAATFALGSGSLIDVQAGTFTGGASANEDWTNNLSDLAVASGATFAGVESNVRVDALSGAGTITSGHTNAVYDHFTFGVDGGSGTFAGVLADGSAAGVFVKAGAGNQTLTGSSTYTGNTTIAGGTLTFSGSGSLYSGGTASGNILVQNGATLAFARNDTFGAYTTTPATTLTLASGSLATSGAYFTTLGHLTLTGGELRATGGLSATFASFGLKGTVTASGSAASSLTTTGATHAGLQLGNNTAGGATTFSVADVTASSAADLTISAPLFNSRSSADSSTAVASGLTKTGAGTLLLSATNTYTGNTTISAGILALSNRNASPNFAISSGAVLEITTSSSLEFTTTTSFSGTGTLRKTGVGGIAWTNVAATFALGSGSLIDVQAGTFTGGSFANEDWTNNRSGLAVASGATFAGVESNVRVDALSGVGTITSGHGNAVYDHFTFGVDGGSGTFSGVLANGAVAGAFVKEGAGTQTLSGANTYTGTTTISGGELRIGDGGTTGSLASAAIVNHATLSFNRSDALTYAGVISGTGALSKLGAGTLTLSGANTYTGNTTLSAGTLQLGAAGALPASTRLVLSTGATLDLNGYSATVGGLSGTGGTVALAGGALTVSTSADTSFAGVLSGSGTFAKQGNGQLTLSGTHSAFTGSTAVSVGTLLLTGSAASSTFTVSGGTLTGTGTTGPLTISAGGTLSPGSSPGTLSAGATTWAPGGAYTWEINNATGTAGSQWDLLNITGALTVTATAGNPFTISLTSLLANNSAGHVINFNSSINSSYTIATASGGFIGLTSQNVVLSTAGFTNALGGGTWSVGAAGHDLNLTFTASAIPEPSTYAALLGLASFLAVAWRRRSLLRRQPRAG